MVTVQKVEKELHIFKDGNFVTFIPVSCADSLRDALIDYSPLPKPVIPPAGE